MWRKEFRVLTCLFFIMIVPIFRTDALAQFYQKSYAIVIGIDKYPSPNWNDLSYAGKDAESMSGFLKSQGFEVISLYDNQATKEAIISKMQNDLALKVKEKETDRILVFFAGHGHTEPRGGKDWGYIVPYHKGRKDSASYISMEELQTLTKKMGNARHQLFIMDACYGGLLGKTRAGGLDTSIPNYLKEVTKRTARQMITAGGKDQTVLDDGPGGHSFFTGFLLEALQNGQADTNGDGYITFSELSVYLVPRASNSYQTPAPGSLPGHGMGEFVFRSPLGGALSPSPQYEPESPTLRDPSKSIRKKTSSRIEAEFWRQVFRSNRKEDYEKYLDKYPNGIFSDIAKKHLKRF